MTFLRTGIVIAIAALILFAGAAGATDVSMAKGAVTFTTPDSWLAIMQTDGDPEARVFQVPDSSPTGKVSLARVTVTVKSEPDINGFQQYMADATAKALALPGYKAAAVPPAPNSIVYTAQENGVKFHYVEHYWMKDNKAIQLRCVRPEETMAGTAWKSAFDKGCAAIAGSLK